MKWSLTQKGFMFAPKALNWYCKSWWIKQVWILTARDFWIFNFQNSVTVHIIRNKRVRWADERGGRSWGSFDVFVSARRHIFTNHTNFKLTMDMVFCQHSGFNADDIRDNLGVWVTVRDGAFCTDCILLIKVLQSLYGATVIEFRIKYWIGNGRDSFHAKAWL